MRNREYKGPSLNLSQEIDEMKYRQEGETFTDKVVRLADSMSDNEEHKLELEDIFGELRFLPAGRVQTSMGSRRITTAYNCFVSGDIDDSMDCIMARAAEAAETMRRGGGIGYDFSKIRPSGDTIKSLDSQASGPVSFMGIFDAVCQTIASSGHRRGAQMGVLRVDHPDIETFIRAKRNSDKLTGFNVSVGVTDEFMEAVMAGSTEFSLRFEGHEYKTINPQELWEEIMESTWDWAEPGVLFIDRIKEMNNLHYCETISATNPCGEQPLPPYGACLLGSFNLVKYVVSFNEKFDYGQFRKDIDNVVRAMDNVIDRTIYPLKEQEDEAKAKRRMGLGVTGLANAGELLGYSYGSDEFLDWAEEVFKCLRNSTYRASLELAKEKGPFQLWNPKWLDSGFAKTLPYKLRKGIKEFGIRNSHLTSIAPTGTISLVADNVSSGIEPPFLHHYNRTIQTFNGPREDTVKDYAFARGVEGRTSNDLSVHEHLAVLALAQHYVDSACSKTINVGDDVSYDEFKNVYTQAFKSGCKGVTTFRAAGKRYGVLQAVEEEEKTESEIQEVPEQSGKTQDESMVEACYFDPNTGQRSCE